MFLMIFRSSIPLSSKFIVSDSRLRCIVLLLFVLGWCFPFWYAYTCFWFHLPRAYTFPNYQQIDGVAHGDSNFTRIVTVSGHLLAGYATISLAQDRISLRFFDVWRKWIWNLDLNLVCPSLTVSSQRFDRYHCYFNYFKNFNFHNHQK